MQPYIIFTEENHRYTKTSEPDFKLVSGTQFVKHYEPPFDSRYWLFVKSFQELVPDFKEQKKAWKYSGRKLYSEEFLDSFLQQLDIDDVMEIYTRIEQEWADKSKASSEAGTLFHLEKELESYARGWELNPFDEKKYNVYQKTALEGIDNYTIFEDLSQLEDGYYPELLIHWGDLLGQADRVFIGTDTFGRYADVLDWKTHEKLKGAFFDEDARRPVCFHPPIEHVETGHKNKASLQMSTYMWMLENHGFQGRYVAMNHFDDFIPLTYMKEEVKRMHQNFPWERKQI